MGEFVKRNPSAPAGYFVWEAAGLRWLSVDGGVRCARVIGQDDQSLTLERLTSVAPTAHAARDFGAQLAVTHDAGAAQFGSAPGNCSGPGYFGPLARPLPMSLTSHDSWGEFYAEERLRPMAQMAAARLTMTAANTLARVIDLCLAGRVDDDDDPARLHGDLWSGNVMWTADGVVLIDPAAHGGHRETDLAMLTLFGCPFLDEVLAGYQSVRRLRDGWRDRVSLHQLFPLLAHVVLFGGGYTRQVERAAATTCARFS